MKWEKLGLKTRLDIMGSLILVPGLLCSLLIYLAADGPGAFMEDELAESKKYLLALELYGGKANVLASDFAQWFGGLWHGRNLAFTMGLVSIIISFGFFCAAYHAERDLPAPGPGRVGGKK